MFMSDSGICPRSLRDLPDSRDRICAQRIDRTKWNADFPGEVRMIAQTTKYGISTTVPLDYATALARTRDALAKEGFGVLTEIDVSATMKKKLEVDFKPYTILGACNPPLAYQALNAEPDIGLLLPCNVIVYAGERPNSSVVAVMDPIAALALTDNEAVRPIAKSVRERLERVLADVSNESHSAAA
jgi:uncharacterized protein (DUF302 family)